MIVTVVLPNGEVVQLDALDDMDTYTLQRALRGLADEACARLIDAGMFKGGTRWLQPSPVLVAA